MATTSKGIYYPNDGTKKAGVMADMQRMAESIDDALTENEFDPTEINQNISNLQVSQKAQDLAIENLQEAFLNGLTLWQKKIMNINKEVKKIL